MHTKKNIIAHFKTRVIELSYKIAYYTYKNEPKIKLNLLHKRVLIIDIGTSIGIDKKLFLEWIETGKQKLLQDIETL